MTSKKIAFLCNSSPYGQSRAKEALDAILATSAFDQEISVVFAGDGVLCLLREQNSQIIEQKNLSNNLQALEMFGVEKIYVQQSALAERGFSQSQLCIDTKLLDDQALGQLLDQQDHCLSF